MLDSPVHSTINSLGLIDIAQNFHRSISKAENASGYGAMATEFQSALEHIGLPSATVFTMVSTTSEQRKQKEIQWAYKFDLQELAFVDAYSKDMDGLRSAREIEILQLDCDHIFTQLSDRSSLFFATFMECLPMTLTLLTLDVSHLSRDGLLSVEKILRLSDLEYLKVICTPVEPGMSFPVARVLRSVQWSTLKSLTFSGHNIETWISLWMGSHSNPFILDPDFDGPQLQHLHLQRTGSAPPQMLSHTSALFIHGLIYLNPSIELVLTNFILKEDLFYD
ncbi:hypothetical protein BG000_001180 [Podila horticola]|nr:hypothetical protein BG000_001180 [Podila horticola]